MDQDHIAPPSKTNPLELLKNRTYVLGFTGIALLILLISPPVILYHTFLNGYKSLDLKHVTRDAERAHNVFSEMQTRVKEKVTDWGTWDEPYHALEKPGNSPIAAFGNVNITETVLSGMNMSFVTFLKRDKSHAVIYTYSDGNFKQRDIKEFDFLNSSHPILTETIDTVSFDYIAIDGIPALIGAKPVVKSDGKGPAVGWIVFGVLINEPVLESLSEQTKLNITLNKNLLSRELSQDAQNTNIKKVAFGEIMFSDRTAVASIPITSSTGKTLASLDIEIPREVLVFGEQSAFKLLLLLCLLMFVSIAVVISLYRLSGANQGISELLKSNHRLREHEDQLKALIDSVPGYVSWFNRSLVYLGVNEKLAKDYNCTPSDFVGKPIGWHSALSEPRLEEEVRALFESSLSTHQTYIRVVNNSEEKHYLLCLEKYSNDSAIVAVGIDITAQWQAEQQSIRDRSIAAHTSRLSALGEMAAGIAHEINNPLAVISGTIYTLANHLDNPEQFAKRKESIERCVERISRIVNNLRKFSRTDDKRDFKRENLAQLIDDSLVIGGVKAKNNDVKITLNLDKSLEILCDDIEIEQVIVNLINNATDAVKLLEERWVDISLTAESDQVVLRVRDSGNGIPEHIVEKLFQPFFTTKKVGEGTGLGLSIIKGILERHEATIELLTKDKNTCFEMRFKRYVEQSKAA